MSCSRYSQPESLLLTHYHTSPIDSQRIPTRVSECDESEIPIQQALKPSKYEICIQHALKPS